MRIPSAILAALLILSPAWASDPAEKALPLGGADTTVELPMLVAPVTVDRRLYHYAYMRVMLDAANMDIAATARDKVPFILDALLRETHRETIALNGDPKAIDGDGLKKRLLAVANTVIGEGSFVSLTFRDTIQTDDPAANQASEEPEVAAAEPPKKSAGH
jgi:hypothetical protein